MSSTWTAWASLCLLLLVCANSVRVESKSHAGQQQTWLPFGFGGMFGGNAVCRKEDFTNSFLATQRYGQKINKLKSLVRGLSERSSFAEIYEVKNRAEQLTSCSDLARDRRMPSQLRKVILGNSQNSMDNVFQGVKTKTTVLLKMQGSFPRIGKCGFYPERINATAALLRSDSSKALQRQLFGRACGQRASERYVAGRSNEEKTFISIQVDAAEQLLKAKKGQTTEDEVSDMVTRIAYAVAELEEEATQSAGRQRRSSSSRGKRGSLLQWSGPDVRWSPSWNALWGILGIAIVAALVVTLAFIPFMLLPR